MFGCGLLLFLLGGVERCFGHGKRRFVAFVRGEVF